MEVDANPQPLLTRSKTEGRISVSGNGIQGLSSPGGEPEGSTRLLQRARTDLASASLQHNQEFNVDRVLYDISRKVNANKKSLLYLFRNNDPSGRGSITRDALHRIIRVLHGFLTSDQFAKLLRRMNIHNRSQITYDVFMACFEDAEPMQKRYLRRQLLDPFWKAATSGQEEGIDLLEPPGAPTFNDVATGMERSRSADDRLAHLRRRMLDVFTTIQQSFPNEGPRDLLLTSKMLRTVIEKAGIPVSIDDANVLWDKLDTARCGLVPLRRFYTFIDPLSDGQIPDTPLPAPKQGGQKLPPPTKSQLVPRLALNNKANQQVARSLNHYHYPPPEPPEQEAAVVDRSLPARPRAALPHVGPRKRQLVLEPDKPVLAQLVNRLIEPREQFMAFCRRFDDDQGNGRIALGQLLGCLLFCGKVVADPIVSQLIQKIGVRLAASDDSCQQPQEAGQGKKYDYKALGCAIFDLDSNRLLANVVQNPEHYYRLLRSEHCVDWCDSEPANYETLEVKFLKFMYADMIRLITELRRLDASNSGTVNEQDFEVAMARIFNTQFSKKQMADLTRGAASDDNGLVIADFIKRMFSTAQPEICRIIAMSSSKKPAQRSTTMAPTIAEALPLAEPLLGPPESPEKPAPSSTTATFGFATEMSDEQAVALLKQVMKDRFHTFDKQFLVLDVKQTKRISQYQLHQILRNMNVHVNMRELGFMWKSVPTDPDGLCSYRRFLLHFVSNGQGNLFDIKKEDAASKTTKSAVDSAAQEAAAEQEINKQLQSEQLDEVLECVRGDVCRQWGVLKERIRQEDASGAGSFDSERLSSVIKGAGVDVTDEALSYLSRKYSSVVRNKRRFFYMPFMRYFTRRFNQDANSNNPNN